MIKIGVIIKELRIEKDLQQKELAQVCNTTQDTISLWELGKRKPDADMIILLCKFFDVSADYLLGLEDIDGSKTETLATQDNNIKGNKNVVINNSKNNGKITNKINIK